jgi:hypothetical protein
MAQIYNQTIQQQKKCEFILIKTIGEDQATPMLHTL